MSPDPQQLATKRIVYTTPAMDAVIVEPGVSYGTIDSEPLTMDLYRPAETRSDSRRPVVVFVTGYSDVGARKVLGRRFKEMGSFTSWAQLVAAAGLVGVTYANTDAADVHVLLEYIQRHAESLRIDATRIAVWACSGHAPNALALSMNQRYQFRCVALLYPYTLDIDGFTAVADASKQFRFATVPAGRSVADLPPQLPFFLARAGKDEMPELNVAFDRFVAKALAANIPLTVVNHSTAAHSFDLFDDSAATRAVIAQTLRFLEHHLA